MERIWHSYTYAGAGLILLIGLYPGLTMISVQVSSILKTICGLIFLAIFLATIVCLCLTIIHKIPDAPKSLFMGILILFIPYSSALSIAIESFKDGNSYGGYWIVLAETIAIFVGLFLYWKKARTKHLSKEKNKRQPIN